ncbi:MAG: hypothetical protein GKR90_22570 [Pseudomonadales bacterium]|nr:hypothetical protein [Pseudomonadales bacterium]
MPDRAQRALLFTITGLWIALATVSPLYMVFGLLFVTPFFLLCMFFVMMAKRHNLTNFWWCQVVPACMIWPLEGSEVLYAISNSDRPKNLHIAFLMLILGHVGGCIYWFAGIYRNTLEFDDAPQKFPVSSLLALPFLIWLVANFFVHKWHYQI